MAFAGSARRASSTAALGYMHTCDGSVARASQWKMSAKSAASTKNLPDNVVPNDQRTTVECLPLQPQASRFDKIDSGDFLALPEQHLISSERTSLKFLFVES